VICPGLGYRPALIAILTLIFDRFINLNLKHVVELYFNVLTHGYKVRVTAHTATMVHLPSIIVIAIASTNLARRNMVESLQGRGLSGVYELVDGNRNVFRAVLSELTDWIAYMCDGSWFQALGPASK